MDETQKMPLDLDRLALIIGRGVIEKVALEQQVSDLQTALADARDAATSGS